MLTLHVVIVAAMLALVQCQRGSFAGKRPIGYPELLNKTTTTVDPLGNRFGEGDSTTERLPVEANGDRDLVDRISKFPIDKQPFWYLNWKALEEQRKNPQTFAQRPSQFAETPNFNTGTQNSNAGTLNSNAATLNSRFGTNSNAATLNSSPGTPNSSPGTPINTAGTNSNTQPLNSKFGTHSNTGTANGATNSSIGTQKSGFSSLAHDNGGLDTDSDEDLDLTNFAKGRHTQQKQQGYTLRGSHL